MIRILQCVNNMHRAGLETVLMNYYRNIDRTQIQFDFLTHRPDRSEYDDEIEALGGRIYRAPRLYPQNYPAYFSYMKAFFAEHPEYRIMHSHIDAMSYLPLLAGKRAGVPVRIAHSHNTSIDRDFKYPLKQLFRALLPGAANVYCACGSEAGRFLFGSRECRVIPNAIAGERFVFDPRVRDRVRRDNGIDGRIVFGAIGRLSYQKNHKFLLQAFAEVLRRAPKAVLLLIGAGEYDRQLREQAEALGIDANVRFMGSRSDVNELYQAMDVFMLPSLFEGIPVVLIEAQFSGLPCVISDKVPTEAVFTDRVNICPLSATAAEWADVMLHAAAERRASDAQNARYDVNLAQQDLTRFYMDLNEKLK